MTFERLDPKRVAVLFAFGAVVISFFDGFHTFSGTTAYASPLGASRMAWWTPLIFGASTGLGGPAFALGYARLGGTRSPPPWGPLVAAFVSFGALYFFSGFYRGPNAVKLGVLAAGAVVLFLVLDRTWQGALCALATAATGPLVEIVLVRAGTFVHLQPDFLGIPMWLPALYLASAPVIGHGARRFLSSSIVADRNDASSGNRPTQVGAPRPSSLSR
jgi:hypothetical protein